jgi:integrase/recombinase XerC
MAGRSGRGHRADPFGLARFYRWLGREGLVPSNPVQDVRAPKCAEAPAQGPQRGRRGATGRATTTPGADPWLEARDAAMVELLYGCGLRVGELVGLDVARASARLDRPAGG